jgi:tetratricopeptide (TPR) repeat protein
MHYLEGEVWDKAVPYLSLAAREAVVRGAHRNAVSFFEHALAAIGRIPGAAEREQAIDLRLGLRTALQQLAEFDRILEELDRAEALSRGLGDKRRLGWVLVFKTEALWRTGQLAAAGACGHDALSIGEALEDPGLTAAASKYLGHCCVTAGEFHEAILSRPRLSRECFYVASDQWANASTGRAVK